MFTCLFTHFEYLLAPRVRCLPFSSTQSSMAGRCLEKTLAAATVLCRLVLQLLVFILQGVSCILHLMSSSNFFLQIALVLALCFWFLSHSAETGVDAGWWLPSVLCPRHSRRFVTDKSVWQRTPRPSLHDVAHTRKLRICQNQNVNSVNINKVICHLCWHCLFRWQVFLLGTAAASGENKQKRWCRGSAERSFIRTELFLAWNGLGMRLQPYVCTQLPGFPLSYLDCDCLFALRSFLLCFPASISSFICFCRCCSNVAMSSSKNEQISRKTQTFNEDIIPFSNAPFPTHRGGFARADGMPRGWIPPIKKPERQR